MLAITDTNTPIFNRRGDPAKSCMTHLKEEFNKRFPLTNRRKDFFQQSQGTQQFTAYMDELRNMAMALEANLSSATAEVLIGVMGIVGCQNEELRGVLQKFEAPKVQDIIKLGEAFEWKTIAEEGFKIKVNTDQSAPQGGKQRQMTPPDVRRSTSI